MTKLTIAFSRFRSFLRRNKIFFEIVFGIIAATGVLYALFHPSIKENPKTETAQPQKQERNNVLPSAEVKHSPSPPPLRKVTDRKNTGKMPTSSEEPKTPQINAPNSVISIDQKGGITAGTVINANTVNISPQKRSISAEQLGIILPALKQLCGTKIKIEYATGDDEQKQFAEDIVNAFSVAGCNIEVPPAPRVLISSYGKGLSFGVNSNPPYPHSFGLLQQALIKAHIESKWIGFSAIPSDQLIVNVGERP